MKPAIFRIFAALYVLMLPLAMSRAQEPRDSLYTANRPPLAPSAFIKLPIGSITPRGWLLHQLELERDGMIGRLAEISPWLKFEESAWVHPESGKRGWEEMPYWLKGYGDLGYVLKDEKIIAEARKWIDAILATQEESGWFGPRSLKTSLEGKPDLWPHMLVLNILQSFHEFSADPRVIPFMLKYHKWLDAQPPETFGNGYWPKLRFGDNVETIHWLYNRTGEEWLLGLARKIHEHMGNWRDDVINWHNVNIAQGFREPGVFFVQGREEKLLEQSERNYRKVMDLYGQFPGGGFAGDENCRPGYTDPRQGFETCGMVEFMHSFEMLTKISGQVVWADRCEEIAFNSLPAAITPEWKGLHYLTCANQVQLDRNNKAPAIENGGTMFSYSPFEVYRCCQHNVSHGWPFYAEELWLATPDRGLCASLYASSEVRAKVADGTTVEIDETTPYPFQNTVFFDVLPEKPVKFPLHLRIPGWCTKAMVMVNGQEVAVKAQPLSFAVLDREWKSGDRVTLRLPMELTVRRWEKNQNAASVHYGPHALSIKIDEKWVRYGKSEQWPELEVFPASSWNYALELAEPIRVEIKKWVDSNPFTPEFTPIMVQAKARKIPAWKQDKQGLVGKLQPSPVKSDEPLETVTLIPMGAARLRITMFPVIGHGPDAHEWTEPAPSPVTASHVFANDSVEAVTDGLVPKSSNDNTIPRFTWWDHRGTKEWIEWTFPKPRTVSSVEVYWFDDTGKGACRAPKSWKLSYRAGGGWRSVENATESGTQLDTFNRLTFKPIETDALRIDAELQRDFSAGILEWRIGP